MNFFDETEADITALIEQDFGRLPSGTDLRRAMLDWLHYKARSIPQRLRAVLFADEVTAKLPEHSAIAQIAAELRAGGDVSPWLSDRVRLQKRNHRADLMFNAWQISHFHLRRAWARKDAVWRSNEVLFAFVNADRAVLLDVLAHKPAPWSATSLLRILVKTSAKDLPEMKGVVSSQNGRRTDEDLRQLLSNGLNSPIHIDGKMYMSPGLGISSSRHAIRLVHFQNFFFRTLGHARSALASGQIAPLWRHQFASTLGVPIRMGVRYQAGQLAIYEKSRNLDFRTFAAVY